MAERFSSIFDGRIFSGRPVSADQAPSVGVALSGPGGGSEEELYAAGATRLRLADDRTGAVVVRGGRASFGARSCREASSEAEALQRLLSASACGAARQLLRRPGEEQSQNAQKSR